MIAVQNGRHNRRTRRRACWFCGQAIDNPKREKRCEACGAEVNVAFASSARKKQKAGLR